MNKPVDLGLSILELSKILMYELCYDDVKPKYGEKEKFCYMDTNSFIDDVETRSDTSNYKLDRPFPKGKNKKVIGLMKYELGGKIMTRFPGLRTKNYSYLIDDVSEDKKAKAKKKSVLKRQLKFGNYKNCFETT